MTPTVANLNPAISLFLTSFSAPTDFRMRSCAAIAVAVGRTTISAIASHSGRLDRKNDTPVSIFKRTCEMIAASTKMVSPPLTPTKGGRRRPTPPNEPRARPGRDRPRRNGLSPNVIRLHQHLCFTIPWAALDFHLVALRPETQTSSAPVWAAYASDICTQPSNGMPCLSGIGLSVLLPAP